MDEEESFRRDNCSFMAVKATQPDSPAPMSCGGHHRHCRLTCLILIYISFKFQIMIQERKNTKTKKNHKSENLAHSIFTISRSREK